MTSDKFTPTPGEKVNELFAGDPSEGAIHAAQRIITGAKLLYAGSLLDRTDEQWIARIVDQAIAAPGMLEALREAYAAMEFQAGTISGARKWAGLSGKCGCSGGFVCSPCKARPIVLAALAKATPRREGRE